MRTLVLWVLMVAAPCAFAQNDLVVENSHAYVHPELHMTVVTGELVLPAEGAWAAVQPPPESGMRSIFLTPPEEMLEYIRGKMAGEAERERKVEGAQYFIQQFYWPIATYAEKHNDIGPATIDDLGESAKYLQENRFSRDGKETPSKPGAFIIPGVPIPKMNPDGQHGGKAEARPLVVELRPTIDDGKHWVLFSDGRTERVPIDAELVRKYDLAIEPQAVVQAPQPAPESYRYKILALRTGAAAGPFKLVARDYAKERDLTCTWDCRNVPADAEAVTFHQWANTRAWTWAYLNQSADVPILNVWAARCATLYGVRDDREDFNRNRAGRSTNVFNVLGGRAAIQETLQMQPLNARGPAAQEQTVPIETIKGVEVKSHPFDEMLKGGKGGVLPLADLVPPDRFFLYFAKPSALLGYLDRGNEFVGRLGSAATRSNMDYDLKTRYATRLGLNDQWGRLFLNSGAVSEIAVFLPDLFLMDGTEITAVLRVPKMPLAQPLFKMIGVAGLEKGEVVRVPTKAGGSAFWTVRGDLLLMSSNEQEMKSALDLLQAKGIGSLGQSAEFRYMLTQLPLQKTTTIYCYLPDPFIRELVGPRVKIAQLRRMRALADLQVLTGGALLYKADGQPGTPTLEKLTELGYVPAELAGGDYSLREDLTAVSARYGTLAGPNSLLTNPVKQATVEEAQAYGQYVTEYTQIAQVTLPCLSCDMEPQPKFVTRSDRQVS